jgi:hypothetical protein
VAALRRTFQDKLTIVQRARRAGRAAAAWSKRHRAALAVLSRQPWSAPLPRGPLILLIDGLWFLIGGRRWVVYLAALRAVSKDRAVFLRPILRPGHESQEQWQEVMQQIPEKLRRRICALISDSFRGVESIAGEGDWKLQRCHAHLRRRIADVFGRRKRTLRWQEKRRHAEQLLLQLIGTIDPIRVDRLKRPLYSLSRDPDCPWKIRGIIREVIRHHRTFCTYLYHPELRLPNTTNTIECMNSLLRELAGRSRGFRSPRALEQWTVAFVRFHSTIKCQPKNPQN